MRVLVAQRIYGVALGYEDVNDHETLRSDSVRALLVGKVDLTGESRVRERDRGDPLASASTLNRLELGEPSAAAHSRYKRIVSKPESLDELLVEVFVESYRKAPRGDMVGPGRGPMTRCTVTRRGGSFTDTMDVTATCRCTSSVGSI